VFKIISGITSKIPRQIIWFGKRFINNYIQSQIPCDIIVNYKSNEQLIINLLLTNLGVNTKIIVFILMFL